VPRIERRRFQRIAPPNPIRARAGSTRVFVLDASMNGFRIAHQEPVTSPCTLRIEWEGGPILAECVVVRQSTHRPAKSSFEKPTFHSGLHIERILPAYESALRQMIAYYVERALDEQRANARGIPATAAASFQTGKGTNFLRCDFIAGRWLRTPTSKGEQPPEGFTISADEEADQIERLCSAYERADLPGRKLIRTFAALSISRAEGIPTRRYTP
jgi:hypothetical protein